MNELTSYKHFFFDLDETVTPTRSVILPDMKELVSSLPVDIIIISGLVPDTIRKHVDGLHCIAMGQNGNCSYDYDHQLLWNNELTDSEKNSILLHISSLLTLNDLLIQDPTDLIEDRGSQISYSLIGHHEDTARKKLSDPDTSIRAAALKKYPLLDTSVEVRISGSTTLDYFKYGAHKGANVRRLIEYYGWDKDKCVYFGDRLHPGGNDEAVIGVIDTVAVKNHRHTYDILKETFDAMQHQQAEE